MEVNLTISEYVVPRQFVSTHVIEKKNTNCKNYVQFRNEKKQLNMGNFLLT